jgi:hypothetical protein
VIVSFIAAVLYLSTFPTVRYTRDARNFDGERYTEYCAGLFQEPTTWVCIEVER